MMAEYYNFKEGKPETGKNGKIRYVPKGLPNLLTQEQIDAIQKDPNKSYYKSIYRYSDKHKKTIEENNSAAGIDDVVTNTLVWDFDSKDDPEQARLDVVQLAHRLVEKYNVDPEDMECAFSGSKGFHVQINLDNDISVDQFKLAVNSIVGDLKTFDPTVFDHARVLRVENTKHNETGLFKIPMHISEIDEMTIDSIKKLAENTREMPVTKKAITLPESLFKTVLPKITLAPSFQIKLDYTKKPKGMQDYVYAILEGQYDSGERHGALMVLAAKCRALGYDKEATYFLCKSSLKKQSRRTGTEEFDKSELWDNIIEKSIYSDRWEGGSYSPKNNPWLQKYCDKLGIRWNNLTDTNITSVTDAFDSFAHYAINIDNLTIKTGIQGLDDNLRLTVGMSAGLVASPGVGKTSISLQMLNNMSKGGHRSVFFSYDMYAPIVYQKLVQKHLKIGSTAMFEKFKNDPKFRDQVKRQINEEYAKVGFCFKTGQTVNDIVDTIKEAEDTGGEKVKFIVMDYNELVITDYSDPTQSSAFVAQKMREIAQSMDLCVFSLFQPSKMSGTPADEVKSYNAAKGSGAISQSVSTMLGMSRPGYNPQDPENDRFLNIACLKNRMGPLFSLDFSWEGFTGTIGKMSDEDYETLKRIRDRKKEIDSGGNNGWS